MMMMMMRSGTPPTSNVARTTRPMKMYVEVTHTHICFSAGRYIGKPSFCFQQRTSAAALAALECHPYLPVLASGRSHTPAYADNLASAVVSAPRTSKFAMRREHKRPRDRYGV